jgi:hypothetical protein
VELKMNQMELELYKSERKKFLMLGCAVFAREIYAAASKSKNIIDIHLVEQGLHDTGAEHMSNMLQIELDKSNPSEYDAVLLGYGLCNNGIIGLKTTVPMVIPRAHDCIAILMGSKDDYQTCFNESPGTFYRSAGWVERVSHHLENPYSVTVQMGITSYEDAVEKYGKENAEFLLEALDTELRNYSKLAFIDTGVTDISEYLEKDRAFAKKKSWDFDVIKGNISIFEKMMNEEWDKEIFLTVSPGNTFKPAIGEDKIIEECNK